MEAIDIDPADPVAGALNLVAAVGEEIAKDAKELAQQSRHASHQRAQGAPVADAMVSGVAQDVLGLVEKMAKRLLAAGATLRKALAQGLAKEGWGVAAISRRFGVSHQRVSAILKKANHKPLS